MLPCYYLSSDDDDETLAATDDDAAADDDAGSLTPSSPPPSNSISPGPHMNMGMMDRFTKGDQSPTLNIIQAKEDI